MLTVLLMVFLIAREVVLAAEVGRDLRLELEDFVETELFVMVLNG